MWRLFLSAYLTLVLLLGLAVTRSSAEPSFWQQCSGALCHANDTVSCNGCHMHKGSLVATANQPTYNPGQLVTVRLNGGTEHGWIRALLYDQSNQEIDRATGPTGTGDDNLGNPVVFPVFLEAPAPSQPGDYVWRAAWFGNQDGNAHIERTTPVTIRVVQNPADVPDEGPSVSKGTWGRIRGLYR